MLVDLEVRSSLRTYTKSPCRVQESVEMRRTLYVKAKLVGL